MQKFTVFQGNQCSIPFLLQSPEGKVYTEDYVEDVEVIIGKLTRTYKNQQIKFDKTTYNFLVPLSQEDTYSFYPIEYRLYIRVKFKNFIGTGESDILNFNGPSIVVVKSNSSTLL